MRPPATTDHPSPLRPAFEVDLLGQLRHPLPVVWLSVLIDRRPPRRFLKAVQGLANGLAERIAEREANHGPAARIGEVVARAGRVRAREVSPFERAERHLLEREIEQLEVILSVVGAGIPGPVLSDGVCEVWV